MGTTGAKLKTGIVGLGHLHPRAYMPLFEGCDRTEVVAACEGSDALREPFCAEFGVKGYAALDEMLEAEKLDIAAVFLPHADCPDAAAACADAGLHLMVEKPMAQSAEGAARIVEAARRNGVKLTTGYCWRMHPGAVQMRRLIEEGVLGRLVGAEGRIAAGRIDRYVKGNAAWMLQRERSGGGPMYNLGVHWIDLFRWMLGCDVGEVSGCNVKVGTDYDIEDNSFAHLKFDNGMVATLDISYTVPDSFPHGRDLYLSVRGTEGVVTWAPAYEGEQDELFVCSDSEAYAGAGRRRIALELEAEPGYSGFMGAAYVNDFARAIDEDRTPAITGDDGVAVLKVVEAIYVSDKEKRWVKVAR